ncbi:MAG: zf-HC2 domain-containing protein [Acidobacteria bacterium]|nr:zf-HC2 domain-containing protein [Acidobacteriota bacterium]
MANWKTKFKLWLSKKTEECKTVTPLFSVALDRRLSLVEKLRVRLHLYSCGACLNYVSNLKFMHEVFHQQEENFEHDKIHASLSPEAKDRIREKLRSQDA